MYEFLLICDAKRRRYNFDVWREDNILLFTLLYEC